MATTNDPLATTATNGAPTGQDGGLKQKLSDATSHVKSTAAEYGRSAAENIDRNVHSAASALKGAASTLRDKAGAGDSRVSNIAQTAAQKLESTASYFENYDTREAVQHLETTVRRSPGISLGVAFGVGLLIGWSMKKDRNYYY
jgi:ElaB/YqjD/DUF883 family membrane-anchored ribosome-binding protein